MKSIPILFCRVRLLVVGTVLAGLVAALPQTCSAQLAIQDQFFANFGTLVSVGFDDRTDRVWVYNSFGGNLGSLTRTGGNLATIARPGNSADDADVEFAPTDFVLNSTTVPAGSLLFIDGESGAARIYAVNKNTGAVIASLTTSFGVSHTVGGAFHGKRGTIFLVADRNDTVTPSTIAEINPQTGAVLNSFGVGTGNYTVNYGDIDVSLVTGNLFLVSSDENSVRELTPTGALVGDLALPDGIFTLSGIALDDTRGEAFLSSTSGDVWRVSGFPQFPPLTITANTPSLVDITWPTRQGALYHLLQRDAFSLQSPWTTNTANISGTGNPTTVFDNVPAAPAQRFFRLQILQ